MKLTINRTVFIKHHVWYLSIVNIENEGCCFWSFHDRSNMPDEKAKIYFERAHYRQVSELVADKMKRENEGKLLITST